MDINVLIADDHQLFRQGLVKLLSTANGIHIIAEAENGKDAIEKVKQYQPDVILMDIGMPEMNGVEATNYIKENFPKVRIIALSMHMEKEFIKNILDAGASGYLLKNCTYDQLTNAINSVFALVAKIFRIGKTHQVDETLTAVKEDGRWKICGTPFALML